MNEMKTIMYVDDEPTNVLLFKYNFQKKYIVVTATSGYDGISKLRTHPEIVIVISDMKMPGMNGIEFIKQAKAEFPGVVFFINSGYDITPEIENALDSKLIHKYLSKPFRISEIEYSIDQVIAHL